MNFKYLLRHRITRCHSAQQHLAPTWKTLNCLKSEIVSRNASLMNKTRKETWDFYSGSPHFPFYSGSTSSWVLERFSKSVLVSLSTRCKNINSKASVWSHLNVLLFNMINADEVAELCYERFRRLPRRGKPEPGREWSLLAAVLRITQSSKSDSG